MERKNQIIWLGRINEERAGSSSQKISWMKGQAFSSHEGYPILHWKLASNNSKDPGVAIEEQVDLVIAKASPHIEEIQNKKNGGGLMSSLFSSSIREQMVLPAAQFSIEAFGYIDLMKSKQYGLVPPRPKPYLLGLASLEEAQQWRLVLDPLLAKQQHQQQLQQAAGKQQEGQPISNTITIPPTTISTSIELATLPVPAVPAPSLPSSNSSSNATPALPCPPTSNTIDGTNDPFHGLPTLPGQEGGGAGVTTTAKDLEKRLEALRMAEFNSRLNTLKNVRDAGKIIHDDLQARFMALKKEATATNSTSKAADKASSTAAAAAAEGKKGGGLRLDCGGIGDDEIEELLGQARDDLALNGAEGEGQDAWRGNDKEDDDIAEALIQKIAAGKRIEDGGEEVGQGGRGRQLEEGGGEAERGGGGTGGVRPKTVGDEALSFLQEVEKETKKQQQKEGEKGGSIFDLFRQAKALLAQDEHPPSPPSQHGADEEEEEKEKEEEGSLPFSSQEMGKGQNNKKKGLFGLGRGSLQPKKNGKKEEGSGLLQWEGEGASDKVLGKYAQLLQAVGGVEEGEGVDHEQVAAIMEQAKQWVEMEGAATGEGGKEEER